MLQQITFFTLCGKSFVKLRRLNFYSARERYLNDVRSKHSPYLFPILRNHLEAFNQKNDQKLMKADKIGRKAAFPFMNHKMRIGI